MTIETENEIKWHSNPICNWVIEQGLEAEWDLQGSDFIDELAVRLKSYTTDRPIEIKYQDVIQIHEPLDKIINPIRQEQLIEIKIDLMKQLKKHCNDGKELKCSEMAFVLGHMVAELIYNVVNIHGPNNLTVSFAQMFYEMIVRAFLAAGIKIVGPSTVPPQANFPLGCDSQDCH